MRHGNREGKSAIMTPHSYLPRTASDVGNAIRDTRRRKKLTQIELSKLSGLGQDTISRFENESPSSRMDTLFRLLSYLELKIWITAKDTSGSDQWEDVFKNG